MDGNSEDQLIEQVRAALLMADALGLPDAALHLNEALIALTGVGIAPADAMPSPVH